ncbi:Omp28-related outer membrane protein [Prevotella sp. E13-17]|uniref:Omp28-related outer membrane protein n=1 Tax=Prevotella sp. E13-17 TaxID=2913616 RepID=UPI001EDB858B|nr:Omp28-related outer membrane protein [Prevotella sp. E13-17]UKK52333.1 Omp28-related outer membrane protein [Prevotella sp. E13-17]
MTKNTIVALLSTLLLSFSVAWAQGLAPNQRVLGYTQTDSITTKGGYIGQEGVYPVGALLSAKTTAPYVGCKIVGIRFAVSQSVGRTRVFLNKVGETGVVELYTQNQKTYEGWNTVFFNGEGITIQENVQYLFGFDYHESSEMAQAGEGALCGFGQDLENSFMVYGNFGSGEAFYPISGIGRLCVQLIIDVSNLPAHDMQITYFDAGFKYKQPNEKFDLLANFENVGRDTLTTFVVGYQIDNLPVVEATVNENVPSAMPYSWQYEVALPENLAIGMHTIKAFIKSLQGEALSNDKEKSLTAQFAIYRERVNRSQAYLEIYSDQNSVYVPFLDKAVGKMLEQAPQVCVANVFRKGNELAVDGASYLEELYAYAYPTFTSNRSYFPGEAYIAYDVNDYLPAIPVEMSAGIIGDVVMQDLEFPSFATVGVLADYNENSRQLTIQADGQLLEEARAIYGDVALTLLLTEDRVKSPQVSYDMLLDRATTNKNYLHDHVLRAFLTAPLGQKLTPDAEGHYHEQVSYTVPTDFVPANLSVIALLTKATDRVTDDNVLEEDIINANSVSLSTLLAVHSTVTGSVGASQYFSLDGKRLDAAKGHRGIVVERQADGRCRKVVVK